MGEKNEKRTIFFDGMEFHCLSKDEIETEPFEPFVGVTKLVCEKARLTITCKINRRKLRQLAFDITPISRWRNWVKAKRYFDSASRYALALKTLIEKPRWTCIQVARVVGLPARTVRQIAKRNGVEKYE